MSYRRVYLKYILDHPKWVSRFISLSLEYPGITGEELGREKIKFHKHCNGALIEYKYWNFVEIDTLWIDPNKKYVVVKVEERGSDVRIIIENHDDFDIDNAKEKDKEIMHIVEMKKLVEGQVVLLGD